LADLKAGRSVENLAEMTAVPKAVKSVAWSAEYWAAEKAERWV
jgi:hypothetical protein